jgi:lysine N6-hydroxylase
LRHRLDLDADGRYQLQRDFSVKWDGPDGHGLYVQNGGRYSHGIAEPQLSLAAWRSAVIVNAILGVARYATGDAALPIEWSSGEEAARIGKAA